MKSGHSPYLTGVSVAVCVCVCVCMHAFRPVGRGPGLSGVLLVPESSANHNEPFLPPCCCHSADLFLLSLPLLAVQSEKNDAGRRNHEFGLVSMDRKHDEEGKGRWSRLGLVTYT